MPSASAPSVTRRVLAWVLLPLLPIAAVAELVAGEIQHRRVPADADWHAAAVAALAAKKPGDVIIVAPRWAEGLGRKALSGDRAPRIDPNATPAPSQGPLLGLDGPFDVRIAGRSDLDTFNRAIVLSAHGARAPETSTWKLSREDRFGPLSLAIYDNPKPDVLVRDLTEEVDQRATVRRIPEAGGAEENCRWEEMGSQHFPAIFGGPVPPARRFLCSPFDPNWAFVGATVASDLNFTPRRCIALHPADHTVTQLTFPPGRIGKKVVAYAGLHAYVERELTGSNVKVRIKVGGTIVAERVHVDGEGWVRIEGSTAAFAGQSLPVSIETLVLGPAGARFTCVAAQLRD